MCLHNPILCLHTGVTEIEFFKIHLFPHESDYARVYKTNKQKNFLEAERDSGNLHSGSVERSQMPTLVFPGRVG